MPTSFAVQPIDATFGAVITGVKLATIDDATWRELHETWLDYGLLVFPGELHTHDDRAAVAEIGHARVAWEGQRPVRCRKRPHIEDFAVGRRVAVELVSIPGGQADGAIVRRSQIRGFRVTRADQSNRRYQRETRNQNHTPPPSSALSLAAEKRQ